MAIKEVLVPDIGGDSADVIEILVTVGQTVAVDESILVLESAKASMEVPCSAAGVVKEIRVKVGDQAKEGDVVIVLEEAGSAAAPEAPAPAAAPEKAPELAIVEDAPKPAPAAAVSLGEQTWLVPDIGSDEADVIEVLVKVGDRIEKDQPIAVLESAKASMEVPAEASGIVKAVFISVGDKVQQDVKLLTVEVEGAAPAAAVQATAAPAPAPVAQAQAVASAPAAKAAPAAQVETPVTTSNPKIHAGPAVRRLARELGVDLGLVPPTGPKNRILKDDVQAWVKQQLTAPKAAAPATASGSGLPALPTIDFAKFGEIELKPLTKIQKVSAQNLHRSWLHIPHVTQFDEADITDLEGFRVAQKDALKKQGVGLTVLAFLVKASAHVLKQMPKFASSLSADGESLVMKKYIHIGVAVDTPNGLVVPVIRNADQKSISDIARELGELSAKARDKKLTPADMQGATFSISSLGGIGGTAFTPIVNWPEVAILGVSRSSIKPVWDGNSFQPRLMLPLSLSYDHRVIDGADAARFTTLLGKTLADLRQILL